ncbi:hypothetical protein N7539_004511 [Penicillium diatomitis]|uniref:AB hydrolase-1 domain-containing protein n=1 Tax=Penicillium diatomitis TaxID=2819901 RepID=A0A9W9XE21_9EURO|nr:uncharacterized protein N7539_004511 [Penicillium diatomitis]KAJ5489621.1 hypothetical protein N7539_004511 [Penicillium diatomitis]
MHLEEPFPTLAQQADSALLNRRRRHKSVSQRDQPSNLPSDPTSPEVISSLISSLSAISVPLNSHFDSIPRIDSEDPPTPVHHETTPLKPTPTRPPLIKNGSRMSVSTCATAEDHSQGLLHPDDAASPPVIRMARAPPSPKVQRSPRSPRYKPFKSGEPLSRPPSQESHTSVRTPSETAVFGTISTEPAPLSTKTPSVASTSSTGRAKSLKDHLGLLRKSSRELRSDQETSADRLRRSSSYTDSLWHNTPRHRPSLRSMYSMANVAEEMAPMEVLQKGLLEEKKEEEEEDMSAQPPTSNTPPNRELPSSQTSPDAAQQPGGIGSGRAIPTRASSLRHRHSQSSSSRRRQSVRHSRYSSTASQDVAPAENGLPGSRNDAAQVIQKIQEVKDRHQKNTIEMAAVDSLAGRSGTSPVRPSRSSRSRSHIEQTPPLQQQTSPIDDFSSFFHESAPSPLVKTGKPRTLTGSPGLSAKPPTFPPHIQGQLSGKPGYEKLEQRQSMDPVSPRPSHRRTPSSPPAVGRPSLHNERPSSADSIDLAVEAYTISPKLTQRVPHPTTGRTIAFSEVGDPKGHVVLCCLGMGLTRYLMAFYDELARTLNLRLVTLDRPGVGESGQYSPDEPNTPLSWPDDVAIVCNHLRVTKFSILAHSAGAIYALATALRIPQHIRGRIHLLAPWIPPSQLSTIGSQKEPVPAHAVPYSQRILRALPTSLLKVANTSFMSATSASITASLPKSTRRAKKKPTKEIAKEDTSTPAIAVPAAEANASQLISPTLLEPFKPSNVGYETYRHSDASLDTKAKSAEEELERQRDYDTRLTHKIWALATANANPTVDLLVCLERRQTIGFRYVDITRSTVIHHGSKDTRVPVENVQWLGKTMRRCEVRILEGEAHGLMASAKVMGNVLTEIAKEWEDWTTIVQGRRRATASQASRPSVSLQYQHSKSSLQKGPAQMSR